MRKCLWMVTIICLCMGILSAVQVYQGYKKGQDEYSSLTEKYLVLPIETEEIFERKQIKKEQLLLPDNAPGYASVDFEELKTLSSQVVAWIDIPGIKASYPVMQAEDNAYYLHRDIYGEYLFAGSIFMDAFNDPALRNMNTIIYGHNMNDRSMFGNLREFRDQDFYDKCPYFWIYTENGNYLYQIFSVHLASNGSSTFTVKFLDAENFERWLIKMKEASEVTSVINPNITDQIATLSTCTGSSSDKQVVQGILIAEVQNDIVTRLR